MTDEELIREVTESTGTLTPLTVELAIRLERRLEPEQLELELC
jgi:hypothetical protein